MIWQDVTQLNDVNESLNIFLTHFNSGFELCFPLKTVKFNKNTNCIVTFIIEYLNLARNYTTRQILIAIKKS